MRKHFLILFIMLIFTCCHKYSELRDDTIDVKFPIEIKPNSLGENWNIDSSLFVGHSTLLLKNKNIKRIILNGLPFEGDFTAEIICSPDEYCIEYKGTYYCYRILLRMNSSLDKDIYMELYKSSPLIRIYGNWLLDVNNKYEYSRDAEQTALYIIDLKYIEDYMNGDNQLDIN